MLLARACLGGLLLAPPGAGAGEVGEGEQQPEAPVVESEPEQPSARTHGLVRVRVGVRGRRDPVARARVLAIDGPNTQPSTDTTEARETDDAGRLELWLLPGRHELVVIAEGFERLELDVELDAGEQQDIELRLDEAVGGSSYRTVVTTERSVAVSSTRLREEEIHELPGSGGDPFAVVRSLPGASQVAGFLPYVVVRGAAPGNTGYYLDGIRVPLLFHVAAGPSVIHPYFIDEVDFYPSGVPVRLGRFASGIIEGRTRPAERDRVRGEVDLRLTDTGALLEIPFDRPRDRACEADADPELRPGKARAKCRGPGRGALTLAGRYSYTGLVLSAIPALNVKLRYWDYQARLDHDLGPRARYTALVFGSYDELGQRQAITDEVQEDGTIIRRVDNDPDPFVRLEFHRINQHVRQRFGLGRELGPGQIDYRVGLGLDRSGVSALRVDEWRVSPRIDVRLPVSPTLELGLGWDQDIQIFRLPRGLDPSTIGTSPEQLGLLLSERLVSVTGLYLDLAWKKGVVEVRPGVRADLWLQVGTSPYLPQARSTSAAFGVDPRLLVRERVAERWALRQSLGVYHQPPDSPLPIPGLESFGLERGLQRNVQATFGWEWTIADIATLTQDVYLGRLSNMQDYELSEGFSGQSNANSTVELDDFLVQVSGWSYGLETMLRLLPGGRAWGWLAYTLSRSTREFPLGGSAPASWDQRHILNLVLGWNVSPKWRLGGRLHFNSGRPYTTQRRDENGELESFIEAARDHRNDARLPPFLQLDARVERIFILRDFRLHLYLDLTNATLAREVLRCDSAVAGEDDTVQVVDGCVNPQALRYVLPSLGLRATF